MYVTYEKITENKARVLTIFFTKVAGENTIEMDDVDIPLPSQFPELAAHLRIDLETNEFYYDYIAPETLEYQLTEMNSTIGNLLLENANDKATISSLEDTLGSLLFEVATLKGGAA